MMKHTVKILRKSASAGKVRCDDCKRGTVYREFEETWVKKRGEENVARRIMQRATGSKFVFIESIPSERWDECIRKNYDRTVVDPTNFTLLCFRQA